MSRMTRPLILGLLLIAISIQLGCIKNLDFLKCWGCFNYTKEIMITTESGLGYHDDVEGTGATPAAGQTIVVHYTGMLENGTKFDSSVDRGEPFSYTHGRNLVIKGWEEGISTMKVGSKRRLYIPANLGYGAAGAGGLIPPHANLIFDVELIAIK